MMLHVITLAQALSRLTGPLKTVDRIERVPSADAPGRILATDVIADADLPAADRSTVDGYAVRAADTVGAGEAIPALLTCVGEVAMGEAPALTLGPGQCCRIWTGGFLPAGADAAVMVEHTETLPGNLVCLSRPAAPGHNRVNRGDELRRGQVVLSAGTALDPRACGTLAALGITSVEVTARPVVGVLSTGNELVEAGETPGPGQLRDVNRPALSACIRQQGGQVRDYGILRDDAEGLKAVLERAAAECDMLVMSGSTSAGEQDYAQTALEQLGEILWHGLAVKPGKPTLGAFVQGKPVLALPGHPAAAYLIWQELGVPALGALLGRREERSVFSARLTEAVSANDGREQLLPVAVKDGLARPIRTKSGLLSHLLAADGYLAIPRNREGYPQGAEVEIRRFYRRGERDHEL